MEAASSGLRPLKTAAGSYPSTARLATSLPGAMPSGTVCASPQMPPRASASMTGVSAASSGVRPPSAACGSSAMPSGTRSTRLRISSAFPRGTARSAGRRRSR